MAIFRKARDNLANGAVLGGLLGVAIVWGDTVLGWIEGIIPEAGIVLGEWSIPIYVIGAGILLGYAIDRY